MNKLLTKQCYRCLKVKNISEFYTHPKTFDGHLGKCKSCTKIDVRERENHLRSTSPLWVSLERDRGRIKTIKSRFNGGQYQPSQKVKAAWAKRNPHKISAQHKAQRAWKKGLIIKPTNCQVCDVPEKDLEMHHDDYSQPLSVRWLCSWCHSFTRRKPDQVETKL